MNWLAVEFFSHRGPHTKKLARLKLKPVLVLGIADQSIELAAEG